MSGDEYLIKELVVLPHDDVWHKSTGLLLELLVSKTDTAMTTFFPYTLIQNELKNANICSFSHLLNRRRRCRRFFLLFFAHFT